MQKVPFWGRDETAPHLEGQYGAREKTSVVFFLISFPQDTILFLRNSISFPRNAMSRERDSYFVGTNYFEGTK